MTPEHAQRFLELLDEVVNDMDYGTWQERKALLLSEANEDDVVNLSEFAAWFEKPTTEEPEAA